MMAPITVLIVDDHDGVRSGIRALLEAETDLRVVGEAARGDEGVASWHALRPDVTLMDLKMPGLDGLAATRAIMARDRTARIVLITTYAGDPDIGRALDAGARRILLKDQLRSTLVSVVREVRGTDRTSRS